VSLLLTILLSVAVVEAENPLLSVVAAEAQVDSEQELDSL
jgi:hypothetical protein